MIPQERLSTEPVPGTYPPPENRVFYALTNYERGPVAIGDTSEGLLYQNWTVSYDPVTGILTALPETTQVPVQVNTIQDLVSFTFTFDQNGRISFAYTTAVSSYLYWFDTGVGQTVTTDLGADAITPSLTLDDKRATQSSVNDMLLWYTKSDGNGAFNLYQLLQRERFTIEHLEATDLPYQYLHNTGMNKGLRVQFILKDKVPNVPYI